MPTSLTYIVLSTRGCSPWRPDAVIGTTGRENQPLPRIFTGRRERTGHTPQVWCFTGHSTLSPANLIPGCQSVKKKRELFPGLPQTSPSSLALPLTARGLSASRFGNVNPIPFRGTARSPRRLRPLEGPFPSLRID